MRKGGSGNAQGMPMDFACVRMSLVTRVVPKVKAEWTLKVEWKIAELPKGP